MQRIPTPCAMLYCLAAVFVHRRPRARGKYQNLGTRQLQRDNVHRASFTRKNTKKVKILMSEWSSLKEYILVQR